LGTIHFFLRAFHIPTPFANVLRVQAATALTLRSHRTTRPQVADESGQR